MTAHDTAEHRHTHIHADGTLHDAGGAAVGPAETQPVGGPVMLDIGGSIGAAIVHLDDDLEGTELPILSLDDPNWDPHTHTGVWRRRLGNTTAVVAIYPQLPAGHYQLTLTDGRTTQLVIAGGEVSDIDLRTG